MKKININEPMFGGHLLVLYDCGRDVAIKYISKKTDTTVSGSLYSDGWYVNVDGECFLWFDNSLPAINKIGIIAHELLHHTREILQGACISHNEGTEEVYAYYQQYFLNVTLKKLGIT